MSKDKHYMCEPLVKAFNYALYSLSALEVPGLPEFQEEQHIVFASSAKKYTTTESYLQNPFKPDLILVKWDEFTSVHDCAGAAYHKSYKSDICSYSGHYQSKLSWLNLLSTVEVEPTYPGGTAARLPDSKTYENTFGDLKKDVVVNMAPKCPEAPLRPVNKEPLTFPCKFTSISGLLVFSCPLVETCVNPKSGHPHGNTQYSTSSLLGQEIQKRFQFQFQNEYGGNCAELKKNNDVMPRESSMQGASTLSSPGAKPKSKKSKLKGLKKPLQKPALIHTNQRISSSFNISHTISFRLIGMLFS